jgi:hypothetical protein
MKITGTLIQWGDLDGEGPGIRIETAAGVVTITGLGEGLLRDEPVNLLYARVELSILAVES